MLIQCPNCKSLFDLPEASFTAPKFRCSTCKHIWENRYNILPVTENKPSHLLNWIFLWSAIGVITVVLYIGYPRLDIYLDDLKAHLFNKNATSFILNDISKTNTISDVAFPLQGNLVDENQEGKSE
ncbi:MAG: zinc-ribbon domain-containing protein [Candidatus Paracaedibacteraceae bacterium]|nr:zinc-ribbon domain-containing protein [Candidatus Paracaedibacteraceae bacterium]